MNEELKFNELYDRITTKTPAHADSLNKIFDLLLENDKFLKYAADSLSEKMLEKGMIANNLVTDNAEMVLSAPMGKLLKQQLDEQNNNLDNVVRFIVEDNTTLIDTKNFIITSFNKGIRAINIFQASKVVIFDETGNFNIVVIKYNGNEITGIAVNHWNGNLYSVMFDKLADKFNWQQMITNSNLSLTIKNILNKLNFIEKNYYCLQGGIEIPPHADLNDYTETGNYYCPWNAKVVTLKNIPQTGDAFTLIVYYATGSKEYIGQRLCNYVTGKVYYRVFNIFSNTWTDWALL